MTIPGQFRFGYAQRKTSRLPTTPPSNDLLLYNELSNLPAIFRTHIAPSLCYLGQIQNPGADVVATVKKRRRSLSGFELVRTGETLHAR